MLMRENNFYRQKKKRKTCSFLRCDLMIQSENRKLKCVLLYPTTPSGSRFFLKKLIFGFKHLQKIRKFFTFENVLP